MRWPKNHTCHGDNRVSHLSKNEWREPLVQEGGGIMLSPEGQKHIIYFRDQGFRTCDFCGSIHPEDLVRFSQENPLRFEVADWKYGWPHKVYIEGVPSPLAGKQVCMGSKGNGNGPEPILGTAPPFSHVKWYNDHLLDEDLDDTAFDTLVDLLWKQTSVKFWRDGAKLHYLVTAFSLRDADGVGGGPAPERGN